MLLCHYVLSCNELGRLYDTRGTAVVMSRFRRDRSDQCNRFDETYNANPTAAAEEVRSKAALEDRLIGCRLLSAAEFDEDVVEDQVNDLDNSYDTATD